MALRRTRRRSSPDLQLLGKQPEGDTKVKDEEKSLFEATENGVLQLGADKVREYLLATYDKVPAWLKDNPHIATGYRVHFSWRLCLRSMFRLHNETMNVWTHLIGFFIFFALLLSMSMTLSPYGYDYFHLDQRMKLSTEMITKYRQHFSAMVDSIQLRLPSWVEIYDRLSDLSREIGGHLNPQVNSTLMAYLDGFKEKLTAIKHAVGGVCETCSVADLDRMRQGLTESVDKIFDSLSSLPNFPAHAVDSAKHRLQEISYFLRSIRLEATPFSDFQTIFPDAIAFLPRWPLAVFISAAMSCLLFSATFHLFYCRSQQAYTLLQQLDYAGICILIAGSMVPAIYYGFYCSKFFRCLYMTMGVALPMIAFFLCMSKYLSGHQARRIRAAIFATAGLANLIPLFHMLMINAGEQRIMLLLSAGGVCYIIGAVFYSTQIPESIFPGKFDIWFHSHSIFHMFVVIAALMHYLALMRFFEWRMMNTCIDLGVIILLHRCLTSKIVNISGVLNVHCYRY